MRLIQIPFSHNCVKIRRALELKGLSYETLDIAPMDRSPVVDSSGQGLVPALEDGNVSIADSTAILRHLEANYPDPSLLPGRPDLDAECWLIEDWADATFMAATRRIAYWRILSTPGALESLFAPEAGGLKKTMVGLLGRRAVRRRFRISEQRIRRDELAMPPAALLAMERLGDRPFLFGDRISVADVALASMAAPLWAARPEVRDEESVARLLAWSGTVLGEELADLYRTGLPV